MSDGGPELAVIVLLPDAVPGRADFMSREVSGWADLVSVLEELETFEPRWRVVSVCHAEDLPSLLEPTEDLGPVEPTPPAPA